MNTQKVLSTAVFVLVVLVVPLCGCSLLAGMAGCAALGHGKINEVALDTSQGRTEFGPPSGGNAGWTNQGHHNVQVNVFGDEAMRHVDLAELVRAATSQPAMQPPATPAISVEGSDVVMPLPAGAAVEGSKVRQ